VGGVEEHLLELARQVAAPDAKSRIEIVGEALRQGVSP
jgi:hypothetical protein